MYMLCTITFGYNLFHEIFIHVRERERGERDDEREPLMFNFPTVPLTVLLSDNFL